MNTTDFPSLPRAGERAGRARLRATPEDFIVEEIIEMEREGHGEHLWLSVRKRGENTDWVAKQLARTAGISPGAVGYAGRKDRHAVTTQWFSLHLPGKPDPQAWELPESVEILEALRRPRKIATGGLRGNRFVITLREFDGDRALLDARLGDLARSGVPNYFGEQRFGREAANLERAAALFRGELRLRDHKERGFLLSAARSLVFNAILARRVTDRSWASALNGDLMQLDGRGGFFAAEDDDTALAPRLATGEIHPTGALWGAGEPPSGGTVGALELAVAAEHAAFARGLEAAGLRQERRSLRLMPRDLSHEWLDAHCVRIAFRLPAGSYATTLLDEVLDLAG